MIGVAISSVTGKDEDKWTLNCAREYFSCLRRKKSDVASNAGNKVGLCKANDCPILPMFIYFTLKNILVFLVV